MMALIPIKKDELSQTEPKLWNRRRQIETPTVFNNVEEIPDSKEKFSVLFLSPQKLLAWLWTVEGTLAMQNPGLTWHTRLDLFSSLNLRICWVTATCGTGTSCTLVKTFAVSNLCSEALHYIKHWGLSLWTQMWNRCKLHKLFVISVQDIILNKTCAMFFKVI